MVCTPDQSTRSWVPVMLEVEVMTGLDGSDAHLTGDQEVAGSTPLGRQYSLRLIMKYFQCCSLLSADSRWAVFSFS